MNQKMGMRHKIFKKSNGNFRTGKWKFYPYQQDGYDREINVPEYRLMETLEERQKRLEGLEGYRKEGNGSM